LTVPINQDWARVALTGRAVSPGIFEIREVLGQETVIKRLSNAISHIKSKKGPQKEGA